MKLGIATVSLLLLLLLALFWRPFRSSASRPESFSAASARAAGPADTGTESAGTNPAISRIFSGDASALAVSPGTIGAYLQRKGVTAASLLVAFQMESNQEHLLTAAAKFPHDPRVQLAVLMHNALPVERDAWILRFKQDAPDNSLPNYIAAHEAFRARHPEIALRELASAAGKPHLRDYVTDSMQALEDLYIIDGRPAAEAKAAGMASVQLPHLKLLRDLSNDILSLQKRYSAAQDQAGANSMAMCATQLGRQLNCADANSLLTKMVGAAIESSALKNYPPEATPDFLKMRVDKRLAQLHQERQKVRDASQFLDRWIKTANERDIVTYFDRMKSSGESAALDWLRTQTTE